MPPEVKSLLSPVVSFPPSPDTVPRLNMRQTPPKDLCRNRQPDKRQDAGVVYCNHTPRCQRLLCRRFFGVGGAFGNVSHAALFRSHLPVANRHVHRLHSRQAQKLRHGDPPSLPLPLARPTGPCAPALTPSPCLSNQLAISLVLIKWDCRG